MNKEIENYTKLAPLYDKIMEDVDYDTWADYVDELIQIHHPDPHSVHEMACGTGTLLLSMAKLECYDLSASDLSYDMVEYARRKVQEEGWDIAIDKIGFTDLDLKNEFDVIFAVFDSVNYLHTEEEILKMLRNTHRALNRNGLLIFDFSTPQNSLEAVDFLNNEEGAYGKLRYFRSSEYDVKNKFHYNVFDIEELSDDGLKVKRAFKEVHKQRVYSLQEMKNLVEQSPYKIIAAYEDFDVIKATDKSARVTMVLKCQKQQ